jgi:FkbM family methyltransferase
MKLSRTNLRIALDRVRPDRPVHRTVRGTDMLLPRRHVLPYMATPTNAYAQNLIDLAALLHEQDDDLVVLDVGANVGDSALLILGEVDCRIVCVEGDPEWLTYLRHNVGTLASVEVEAALLSDESRYVTLVHGDVGTSRLEPAGEETGIRTLGVGDLLDRHPALSRVRLVKSDTDGWDVKLAPAYARAFAASRPVIFIEYDPRPTVLATPELAPSGVFDELADLGYEHAVVWTNGGHVLGSAPTRELTGRSAVLETGRDTIGYQFWDVAVAHVDDAAGQAVLRDVEARAEVWTGLGSF